MKIDLRRLCALGLCAALLCTQGCARGNDPAEPLSGSDASALTQTVQSSEGITTAAESQTQTEKQSVRQLAENVQVREQTEAILARYGTVGAQIVCIRNGVVDGQFCYGAASRANQTPVEYDTKFRCASLSKLPVAMMVMHLQEKGLLDIRRDIGDYLGYAVRNPKHPDTPITCEMLMTHTSGILDSEAFRQSRGSASSTPMQKLLSKSSTYASYAPGNGYQYSNFGIATLAAVAECAVGKDFDTLVQEALLRPLGLDAGYVAADVTNGQIADLYDANGSLYLPVSRQLQTAKSDTLGQTHHLYQGNLTISAADYARLLCVLLNGGRSGNLTLLRPESVREILRVQYSNDAVSQGYCIKRLDKVVDGREMWGHTGCAYGMFSSFALDVRDGSGVVIFTSGSDAKKDESDLFDICAQTIRLWYDLCMRNDDQKASARRAESEKEGME